MTHYFRCIKGVFEKDDDVSNVLSYKNELWKVLETDDGGVLMTCIEGMSKGWDISFTNQQMAECFEWVKSVEYENELSTDN